MNNYSSSFVSIPFNEKWRIKGRRVSLEKKEEEQEEQLIIVIRSMGCERISPLSMLNALQELC